MKINRDRLVQIIKEELDVHTRDLYSRDLETAGDIGRAEEAIQELQTSLLRLKTMLMGEETILGYKGYPADNEPDMSGITSEIAKMEQAIEDLRINIQLDIDDLRQRK